MAAARKATVRRAALGTVSAKKPAWPKTLGACIDLLYTKEQARLLVQQQTEDMKASETALEQHIMDTFSKDELRGASGKVAKCNVLVKEHPQVEDWSKLYPYIAKKKAWDLLQKRMSSTAVRARWDDNVVIPGVSKFTQVKLSLTKLK